MIVITADQSRQARREFGLSQADVAEATGLKRQYLSEFESETALRFTASQLRKLRAFYEKKLEEALAAGEEIELVFGEGEADPASAPAKVEAFASKRFVFPVADEVSDDTLAATLATITDNDKSLAAILSQVTERSNSLFGSGEYTEATLQAFRDAFSLLAANYLLIRTVGGWPEIGLAAANVSMATDTVLAGIIASAREAFEQAGLIGKAEDEEEAAA